ncbi:hypothetical protein [Methylotenera sp.]|uniref:hypothetical protein n=1 Tax=Methylotenera sp. TaxID=2051956 RepID=UPI0027323FD0|nr:hypothetical protein [Methylotenera sp.]MDP3210479.1 hypothetical protein [Methylotenera sp.]
MSPDETTTMLYEKSTLGFNEFTNNKRTLGVRERQVLLLVNGVRNLDELNKFFKKDLLLDTIKKLETEGYIQLPQGQQRPPEFASSMQNQLSLEDSPTKTEPICPTKMATVKAILIEAADDYLGIMGRGIKAKIESCDNDNNLRQTISSWHMAMRESKLGRESASFLMEQIHKTLEGKIVSAENLAQSQH